MSNRSLITCMVPPTSSGGHTVQPGPQQAGTYSDSHQVQQEEPVSPPTSSEDKGTQAQRGLRGCLVQPGLVVHRPKMWPFHWQPGASSGGSSEPSRTAVCFFCLQISLWRGLWEKLQDRGALSPSWASPAKDGLTQSPSSGCCKAETHEGMGS